MSLAEKIELFRRMPLRHKFGATKRRLASACKLPRHAIASANEFRARMRHNVMSAIAAEIPSGLGDSANLLYGLVRSMKPETCVEIGSAQGKSACYIGMALKENGNGKLYAIDPHEATNWNDWGPVGTIGIFHSNITSMGVSDQIVVIRSYSEEAAKNWHLPIDMIFIDGDHSYEGVKRDWELFVPHVKPFGIVVFHDTIWELITDQRPVREDMGVPRFVDELRRRGYQILTIDRDCGFSLVQPIVGGCPLR